MASMVWQESYKLCKTPLVMSSWSSRLSSSTWKQQIFELVLQTGGLKFQRCEDLPGREVLLKDVI